ncbi:hypothetical protein [Pseudoxanthomonas kaohsiungensis]|uniref:Uncharacterized protein n=1 Tax=Pseudoxanthomonas kaohsiungensis TaxID=283923 RepID=A0ABW3LXQ8_9GAMM|nr:hypothetical protein [Pseudoxanthomonas kaohsiungensis]
MNSNSPVPSLNRLLTLIAVCAAVALIAAIAGRVMGAADKAAQLAVQVTLALIGLRSGLTGRWQLLSSQPEAPPEDPRR